jgi:hypothetical protein
MAGTPSLRRNLTMQKGERNMTSRVDDIIGGIIILIFFLGWFDWLWIFGIESSRSWTWWYLMSIWGAE